MACSPVGNGGTGGEGPVFALAFAFLSGVDGSALNSVLCSDCAAFFACSLASFASFFAFATSAAALLVKLLLP